MEPGRDAPTAPPDTAARHDSGTQGTLTEPTSAKQMRLWAEVWPVIHLQGRERALHKARIAFRNGCPGVFIISMEGRDEGIAPIALELKKLYPSKLIGVNYLRSSAEEALRTSLKHGFDATWSDDCGVHSDGVSDMAKRIGVLLKENPKHLFFGSVAFKYKRIDTKPEVAAAHASALGMIATTSGPMTGVAAPVEKLQALRKALGSAPLAVASGVTPHNVHEIRGLVTHILVATGISNQLDDFDETKLHALLRGLVC